MCSDKLGRLEPTGTGKMKIFERGNENVVNICLSNVPEEISSFAHLHSTLYLSYYLSGIAVYLKLDLY